MANNIHTANLLSLFTQAQLQLSKQLVKCNKAIRCGPIVVQQPAQNEWLLSAEV